MRVGTRDAPHVEVENVADLDSAADEVLTGRVNVGHDQHQALSRAGGGGGQPLAERDRAAE